MTWSEEKRKSSNLKFDINDILNNQWTQEGYDVEEALKCIIKYAKRELELLDTI